MKRNIKTGRSTLLLLCILFACQVKGQRSPIYIFAEAGGNGLLGSVNFGKPVVIHPDYDILIHWGIGWTPKSANSATPINMPTQIFLKYGKKGFALEAGLGSTLVFQVRNKTNARKIRQNTFFLSPHVGCRFEARKWFTRIYTGPLFQVSGEKENTIARSFGKLGISYGLVL